MSRKKTPGTGIDDVNVFLESLVDAEASRAFKRYRMEFSQIKGIFAASFQAQRRWLEELARRHPAEDVTRLAAYKKIVKEARKRIYYQLRQYGRDDSGQTGSLLGQLQKLQPGQESWSEIREVVGELLRTHVSTQERFPFYNDFYRQLFDLIPAPKTVVDFGCGLHPLSYPFEASGKVTQHYLAIDKSAQCVEIVSCFARLIPERLEAARVDLSQMVSRGFSPEVDLALMLKLIPAIHRRDPEAVAHLARCPARQALVTANTRSMTRKESIEAREDRILRRFVEMTGRPILAPFRIENEFGYLLGPAKPHL